MNIHDYLLSDGYNVYMRVAAENSIGLSAFSYPHLYPASGNYQAAPLRPTNIDVVSTSRSTLNLTWTAPENSGIIDHYEVEVVFDCFLEIPK